MQILKYLVCPGEVISKTDGDIHYISADRLIRLYNVDPRECLIKPKRGTSWTAPVGLITLTPRFDGDYKI